VAQELAKVRNPRGQADVVRTGERDGEEPGGQHSGRGGVPGSGVDGTGAYRETLEVEAFISNQDIDYVRTGQKAEVKIHTFPFTKYGVIDATVEHMAEDATVSG
jgi:hypothetical protein